MSGSGDERLQRSIAHLFDGDEEDDDTYEPATEPDEEHSDGDDYTGSVTQLLELD